MAETRRSDHESEECRLNQAGDAASTTFTVQFLNLDSGWLNPLSHWLSTKKLYLGEYSENPFRSRDKLMRLPIARLSHALKFCLRIWAASLQLAHRPSDQIPPGSLAVQINSAGPNSKMTVTPEEESHLRWIVPSPQGLTTN